MFFAIHGAPGVTPTLADAVSSLAVLSRSLMRSVVKERRVPSEWRDGAQYFFIQTRELLSRPEFWSVHRAYK